MPLIALKWSKSASSIVSGGPPCRYGVTKLMLTKRPPVVENDVSTSSG